MANIPCYACKKSVIKVDDSRVWMYKAGLVGNLYCPQCKKIRKMWWTILWLLPIPAYIFIPPLLRQVESELSYLGCLILLFTLGNYFIMRLGYPYFFRVPMPDEPITSNTEEKLPDSQDFLANHPFIQNIIAGIIAGIVSGFIVVWLKK